MKEIKKYMTMSELEAHPGRTVYAVNNSPKEMRSEIIFAVERPNSGQEDVIRIPLTWIPIDLTAAVSKATLLSSPRFRQTHQKGLIRIVTDEYASVLLNQEGADIERRKVEEFFRARLSALQNAPSREEEDEERINPVRARIQARRSQEEAELDRLGAVTTGYKARLEKLVGKPSIEVISSLRNEGDLTMKELKEAMTTLGSDEKVADWLRVKARALKKARAAETA